MVTKNLNQGKLNPKFIKDFNGHFCIYMGQYLRDISDVGMKQPARDTHAACKLFTREDISCLSKIELLRYFVAFLPQCEHLLWYLRKQSDIGKYKGQKRVLSKAKVKC